MAHFAGIGAVRIQTWIAQSATKLFLVRGASRLLSQATKPSAIEQMLKDTKSAARVEPAAGAVAGVVALRAEDRETLVGACKIVLETLGRQIPGLQWEGWIEEADSYVAAYAQRAGTAPDLRHLPALPELGLVRTCEHCGAEPATGKITHGDVESQAGPDCLARNAAWQKIQHLQLHPRARENADPDEQMSLDIPGSWPDDFEHLARKGGTVEGAIEHGAVGRTDSRSHLATIAADGNGIGALFSLINQHSPELRATAVTELDRATRAAVVSAAKACAEDPTVKVVIPHYVGGDDVLLSVPAANAWTFAVNLGLGFERLRETLDQPHHAQEIREAAKRLGLGIGIAFAQRSHPISSTTALAHEALARAKTETNGGESAIAWIDRTDSGEAIHAITVASAAADFTRPNEVFQLNRSARGMLASIVSSGHGDLPAAVEQWARRTKRRLGSTRVAELPATISRARWWPDLPDDNDRADTDESEQG